MAAPWGYVDTSMLAWRYTGGIEAAPCNRLLRAHRLVTSGITVVELASALARRHAVGDLSAEALEAARRRVSDDLGFWQTMPVSEDVLRAATDVAERTGARALDALHLGSAILRKWTGTPDLAFLTRDVPQAEAARRMGLKVVGVA